MAQAVPSVNVAEMIAQYEPEQRLARAMAVYRNAKEADEAPALSLALALFKETAHTAAYKDFVTTLFEKGKTEVTLDQEWVNNTDKTCAQALEKLQVKLGHAQNNLQKESVRVALMDLGKYYATRGDVTNAMRCFNRSKESCTTAEHTAELCLAAIQTSLFSSPLSGANFGLVAQYVQRGEQAAAQVSDSNHIALRIAAALSYLDRKQYKSCANSLTSIRKRTDGQAHDFTSSTKLFFNNSDLLLLVTLTVLATFDRSELNRFLQNSDYKVLFEPEPELRSAISCFYECEYSTSLATLKNLAPRLKHDYFLASHSNTLLTQIRNRALKQYTSPFLTLDLKEMAKVFQTELAPLETELGELIVRGVVDARIDKANSVLHAKHQDPKVVTLSKAVNLGNSYNRDTEVALRMLSLQRNGVMVKPSAQRLHGMMGAMRPGGDPYGRQ